MQICDFCFIVPKNAEKHFPLPARWVFGVLELRTPWIHPVPTRMGSKSLWFTGITSKRFLFIVRLGLLMDSVGRRLPVSNLPGIPKHADRLVALR